VCFFKWFDFNGFNLRSFLATFDSLRAGFRPLSLMVLLVRADVIGGSLMMGG